MAQAKTKKVTVTAGGEKHLVYKKTIKKGEGKVGNIMVNHPTKDKGEWDTIDLTAKGRAKTLKQGIADTKRWHRENPTPKMQKGGSMKPYTLDPGFSKPVPKVTRNIDPGFYRKPDTTKVKGLSEKKLKFDKDGKVLYKTGGSTPAWTRSEGKNKTGGLNAKGVASYRAANPGSKLQTAVTTKPSKLKAGSKDAKRRKSFCARMSGMPGPAKKPNGEPSRKTLALRKWNC